MKNVFAMAILTVIASSAFAAQTPQSDCRIRINGQETGDYATSETFFKYVVRVSRQTGCAYGKIYNLQKSGRVYENGQLVMDPQTGKVKDLSNAEADRAKRAAGGACREVSCDEIGIVRGNESIGNELPPVVIINGGSQE